jgi:hypothetical protein
MEGSCSLIGIGEIYPIFQLENLKIGDNLGDLDADGG